MKKIMIVAAVAAIAGGAFALDGYDFTATLKTTNARAGQAQVVVNLGADGTGTNFWYNDARVTNYLDSSKMMDGKRIRTIKDATVKNNTALQDILKVLSTNYVNQSGNKWCATFRWNDTGCYRVAGSVRIDVDLFTTNCCDVGTQLTNTLNGATYGISVLPSAAGLVTAGGNVGVQRFGSLAYSNSTRVEMLSWNVTAPTTADNGLGARRWFNGVLAGQGSFANGRVTTVSGGIVGMVDAPRCIYCCSVPENAHVFECGSGEDNVDFPTAAYGTFHLKYNRNL